MALQEFNETHSRIIAESLYRVASCDGIDAREEDLLDNFLALSQSRITRAQLSSIPDASPDERTALGSTWLRRVLLRACIAMARSTGQVAQSQRDLILDLIRRMGLAEAPLLHELDAPIDGPVTLEWLKELKIDYVSWDDFPNARYFWTFPHAEYPISERATLRVHDGQALLVGHEGVWTDLLGPGSYLFVPESLPGFAEKTRWQGGDCSAQFVFVRTTVSPVLRWGLGLGVNLNTTTHGAFRLQAFGKANISLSNIVDIAARFLTAGVPGNAEMDARLGRVVAGRFAEAVRQLETEHEGNILPHLEDMDSLRDLIAPRLRDAVAGSGIALHRFEIENLTAPPEVGLHSTSARSKAMHLAGSQVMGGSQIMGGTRTNLYSAADGASMNESFEPMSTGGSHDSPSATELDFEPSTHE